MRSGLRAVRLAPHISNSEAQPQYISTKETKPTTKTQHVTSPRLHDEEMKLSDDVLRRIRDNDASIQQLNISDDDIGDEGARCLADALKTNTSLQKLNISWTHIGDEGAQWLADTLKTNTTLQLLHISDDDIGAEGARYLADALKTNASLQNLNISANNI